MILIKHELKQGWKSLVVWTVSIVFFIIVCVFLYPEMKGEMEDMNEIFSSMGAFSAAFGMDRLNFGTLIGFYSTECGNILGLGGAFFASLIAVSSLAKEYGHTLFVSFTNNMEKLPLHQWIQTTGRFI